MCRRRRKEWKCSENVWNFNEMTEGTKPNNDPRWKPFLCSPSHCEYSCNLCSAARKSGNAESKLPDDPYQSRTGPKFAIKLLSFNSFLLSPLRSHLWKRSSRRRRAQQRGRTGSTLKSSTREWEPTGERRKKYHHNHYPLNPPDKYSPFHFGIFVLTKKQSQRSGPTPFEYYARRVLIFYGWGPE